MVAALLAITLWCGGIIVPEWAMAEASYPSRPIHIVTPLAAGAASDIALRILAEKLSSRFGVPVIVQNEPGGAGVIAARTVTNARTDGYRPMSALPPKADIETQSRNGCFVPIAYISTGVIRAPSGAQTI